MTKKIISFFLFILMIIAIEELLRLAYFDGATEKLGQWFSFVIPDFITNKKEAIIHWLSVIIPSLLLGMLWKPVFKEKITDLSQIVFSSSVIIEKSIMMIVVHKSIYVLVSNGRLISPPPSAALLFISYVLVSYLFIWLGESRLKLGIRKK